MKSTVWKASACLGRSPPWAFYKGGRFSIRVIGGDCRRDPAHQYKSSHRQAISAARNLVFGEIAVDYAFALGNGLGTKAYNGIPVQSDAAAHAFHSGDFHSPVVPDGIGAVCYSFITNCAALSWFDNSMSYKEIVLMSMFSYYLLNIWRMVSCGGDVSLVSRDLPQFLSPMSYKIFERVAVRPAIDVANATEDMQVLIFRNRQTRTLESLFSLLKSDAPSQNPTFPRWQKASVQNNNRVVKDSKHWTPQAKEKRKPLQPEKLVEIAGGALFVASVFMAKLCPKSCPNLHIGAEKLREEFAEWSKRMEIVLGSELHTEAETPETDSDEEEAADHTLASNIVDAADVVADYHDEAVLAAASSSTETAVGVDAVPGSGAVSGPEGAAEALDTVPGSGAVSGPEGAAEALETVPGSGAVSELVVAAAAPTRSTAVRTMKETMEKIAGDASLPDIVDELVVFSKEVRKAFGFGPKFSIGADSSEWNKFQHQVSISLPDQSGTAKRNTREGVFIEASKLAAQVFHDSAMAGMVSDMLTDISAVTILRPRAQSRSLAEARKGPSEYIPQVVIALPGNVYLVGQIMLGPCSTKKGRAGKICRQATHPVDRALVKYVRAFELEWQDERTLRLRWDAKAPLLKPSDVVVQLKVERKVDISPGETDFVLPSSLVGCKGRIKSACERFMLSRGDSADPPEAPTAKEKAAPKAKAKAKAKPPAQGGSASVALVTLPPGPSSGSATIDSSATT